MTLLGVMYWAQWYENRTPKYDVFIYSGSTIDGQLHFFKHKNGKYGISKKEDELFKLGFIPFLLDKNKILEFLINGGYKI